MKLVFSDRLFFIRSHQIALLPLNYVVAPGDDIYSTVPGNDYKFMDGTSMATPYVSGVAALMLSANPYLTPNQVRQIITGTAIG